VTHRPIRQLPDGTRLYADYHRYTPVPPEKRKRQVRKPEDPRAVRFHGQWLLPLELLEDHRRGPLPQTRPDTDAYDHMNVNVLCRCDVCLRPEAERWRRKWRRDHGLK